MSPNTRSTLRTRMVGLQWSTMKCKNEKAGALHRRSRFQRCLSKKAIQKLFRSLNSLKRRAGMTSELRLFSRDSLFCHCVFKGPMKSKNRPGKRDMGNCHSGGLDEVMRSRGRWKPHWTRLPHGIPGLCRVLGCSWVFSGRRTSRGG